MMPHVLVKGAEATQAGARRSAAMSKSRRYAIEVSDADTDQIVLLTGADWTEEEERIALAQILRLAKHPTTTVDEVQALQSDPQPPLG
jgi:hypothetical protein